MHPSGQRLTALLLSLAFNAAIVWGVLQVRFAKPPVPERVVELTLELPPPPPPPLPPPPPEEKKPVHKVTTRIARSTTQRLAKPVQSTVAPTDPGPPVHFLDPAGEVQEGSGAIGGGQAGTGKTKGSERRGMHAPSDYADKVKARIIAAKSYPAEAIKKFQECFISYVVTVDRNGNLIDSRIDTCGHPLLDQAARDAIAKAGPFPAPPDTGAERYDIHGSLIFRLDGTNR